jgi:hypothetical protein
MGGPIGNSGPIVALEAIHGETKSQDRRNMSMALTYGKFTNLFGKMARLFP